MAVRAKFIVSKVSRSKYGVDNQGKNVIVYSVTLFPTSGGTDEDRAFWQSTPGGEIKLDTVNALAGEQFEPGDAFYIDFTRAT